MSQKLNQSVAIQQKSCSKAAPHYAAPVFSKSACSRARSPLARTFLPRAAAKSSMRFRERWARAAISASIWISGAPFSSAAARLLKPFIAIHGQCAQLLQVALWPAVGAAMKCLSGASARILCRTPISVATMISRASSFCARMLGAQQPQLDALEFIMYDTCTLPEQHIGAGFLLNVAAQMLVGRPQDFFAARAQVCNNIQSNR